MLHKCLVILNENLYHLYKLSNSSLHSLKLQVFFEPFKRMVVIVPVLVMSNISQHLVS